jgi:hypothetical protein
MVRGTGSSKGNLGVECQCGWRWDTDTVVNREARDRTWLGHPDGREK